MYTKENLHQLIDGLINGDVIECLFQEKNLTLPHAGIAKCRAQEAAKRQCNELTGYNPEMVIAIKHLHQNLKAHTIPQTCIQSDMLPVLED